MFEDFEAALPYVELPFQQESYFRYVDRPTAEDMLRNRVDGSFLVRPYKEQVNICVLPTLFCLKLKLIFVTFLQDILFNKNDN